jgi:ABC-2 type transport system permease protein
MAFLMQFSNRWSSLGWLGGKLVRLVFFLIFLTAIFRQVPSVAGYSLIEAALFFLTFNIVDIVAQLFLRGLYMVGRDIREGDMDFYLIQPLNPLFRISSNLVDFLDFLTLIPVLALAGYILPRLMAPFRAGEMFLQILLYVLLCLNGLVIAFCIHVIIASVTVRTQQMENTIWLYRDLVSLGRFPVDIYTPVIQAVLTFALPVAVMVSYPSQALLGILSADKIGFAFLLSGILLAVSLAAWKRSLKHYSSVSS